MIYLFIENVDKFTILIIKLSWLIEKMFTMHIKMFIFVASVLQLCSTSDWKRIKNLLAFYFWFILRAQKNTKQKAKAWSEMLNECYFYRMGWRAVEWFKMLGWIKDVYLFKRTRNIKCFGHSLKIHNSSELFHALCSIVVGISVLCCVFVKNVAWSLLQTN